MNLSTIPDSKMLIFDEKLMMDLILTNPLNDMECWTKERQTYLLNYCQNLSKTTLAPFVSVGSGEGKFEKLLKKRIGKKIICVDNLVGDCKPINFAQKPDYATCESLLNSDANKQLFIDKCILLILWPYDSSSSVLYTAPNKKYPYDVEAIVQLQPQHIIVLYEEYGGAGSMKLHQWLSQYTSKTQIALSETRVTDKFDDIPAKYRLEHEKNWKYQAQSVWKQSIQASRGWNSPALDALFDKSFVMVHLARV